MVHIKHKVPPNSHMLRGRHSEGPLIMGVLWLNMLWEVWPVWDVGHRGHDLPGCISLSRLPLVFLLFGQIMWAILLLPNLLPRVSQPGTVTVNHIVKSYTFGYGYTFKLHHCNPSYHCYVTFSDSDHLGICFIRTAVINWTRSVSPGCYSSYLKFLNLTISEHSWVSEIRKWT